MAACLCCGSEDEFRVSLLGRPSLRQKIEECIGATMIGFVDDEDKDGGGGHIVCFACVWKIETFHELKRLAAAADRPLVDFVKREAASDDSSSRDREGPEMRRQDGGGGCKNQNGGGSENQNGGLFERRASLDYWSTPGWMDGPEGHGRKKSSSMPIEGQVPIVQFDDSPPLLFNNEDDLKSVGTVRSSENGGAFKIFTSKNWSFVGGDDDDSGSWFDGSEKLMSVVRENKSADKLAYYLKWRTFYLFKYKSILSDRPNRSPLESINGDRKIKDARRRRSSSSTSATSAKIFTQKFPWDGSTSNRSAPKSREAAFDYDKEDEAASKAEAVTWWPFRNKIKNIHH